MKDPQLKKARIMTIPTDYIKFVNDCLNNRIFLSYEKNGLYIEVDPVNRFLKSYLPLFKGCAYFSFVTFYSDKQDLYGLLCHAATHLIDDTVKERSKHIGIGKFHIAKKGGYFVVSFLGKRVLTFNRWLNAKCFVKNAAKLISAKEWVYEDTCNLLTNISTGKKYNTNRPYHEAYKAALE